MRKILPQAFNEDGTPSREAIEIVDGLIQVSEMGSNENGDPIEITREVHGKYNRAKMTLGTDSIRGTSYHEAMHFILDLFFTPTQKGLFVDKLRAGADFKNAQIENLTAEEAISEVFRKGLNEIQEGSTSGEFSKFFNNSFVKKVFFRIRAFFGLEEKTINELFYNILSGKYARKEIKYKGTSYERHLEVNNNSINSREQMVGSTINISELMQIGVITYTNEDGQPCASAGMNTGFTKGFP